MKRFVLGLVLALLANGCGDDGGDAAAEDLTNVNLDDEAEGPVPAAEYFVDATGTCPGFVVGDGCEEDAGGLNCTFEPEGLAPRQVRLWFDESVKDADSPLVFFFHGLGGSSSNAVLERGGLGPMARDAIVADGGILVSMSHETGRPQTATSLPWKNALYNGNLEGEGRYDDLAFMDEIVACADEALGINRRRIHATGMSAGGIMTSSLNYLRNGYLASVAPFSGGMIGTRSYQDEARTPPPPYMMNWGGVDDKAVGQDFQRLAEEGAVRLEEDGAFFIQCDHGMGHVTPADLAVAAWQFFKNHPYGIAESPYAGGELPEVFPEYCTVP